MILIGNRLHLEFKRAVPRDTAESFAAKNNMEYFEVSPLADFNIHESLAELTRLVLRRSRMEWLLRPNKVLPLQDLCCRCIVHNLRTIYDADQLPLPAPLRLQLRSFANSSLLTSSNALRRTAISNHHHHHHHSRHASDGASNCNSSGSGAGLADCIRGGSSCSPGGGSCTPSSSGSLHHHHQHPKKHSLPAAANQIWGSIRMRERRYRHRHRAATLPNGLGLDGTAGSPPGSAANNDVYPHTSLPSDDRKSCSVM